mmetsp:Transcript_29785/g.69242  ORF Transcript_29785/g.69242 Transcript_29785/m.69242 type:complete len:99 (+) Transcript_29785:240-536(+)
MPRGSWEGPAPPMAESMRVFDSGARLRARPRRPTLHSRRAISGGKVHKIGPSWKVYNLALVDRLVAQCPWESLELPVAQWMDGLDSMDGLLMPHTFRE